MEFPILFSGGITGRWKGEFPKAKMQHVKGKRRRKEKKNVKIQKNLTGMRGVDLSTSLEMTKEGGLRSR